MQKRAENKFPIYVKHDFIKLIQHKAYSFKFKGERTRVVDEEWKCCQNKRHATWQGRALDTLGPEMDRVLRIQDQVMAGMLQTTITADSFES